MEKKTLRQKIPPLPSSSKVTVGTTNHRHVVETKSNNNINNKENCIPDITRKDSLEKSYNHHHNRNRVKSNNIPGISSPIKNNRSIYSLKKPTMKDSTTAKTTADTGDAAGNILRAGESLESLFCIPGNDDMGDDHKQMCRDIVHGHLTQNAQAWCKALEYARDQHQRTSSTLSSTTTNLFRLHKRAMTVFPLSLNDNDKNITMTDKQQKDHILAIWLYYVDVLSKDGTGNDDDDSILPKQKNKEARTILYHIQKNRWGEKVAAFYITAAHLELKRQPSDSTKIQKAIRIIQAGIKRQASPVENLHECLQKLQKQQQDHNEKNQDPTNSSSFADNHVSISDTIKTESLAHSGERDINKKSNSIIPCLPKRNITLITKKDTDTNKVDDKSDSVTVFHKNVSASTDSDINSSRPADESDNTVIEHHHGLSPPLDQILPVKNNNCEDGFISNDKIDNERKLRIDYQKGHSSLNIDDKNKIINTISTKATSRNSSSLFKRKLDVVASEGNTSPIKNESSNNNNSQVTIISSNNSNRDDVNMNVSQSSSKSHVQESNEEGAMSSQKKASSNTNDILFPSSRLKRKRSDIISRRRLGGRAVRVVASSDAFPLSMDEIDDEDDSSVTKNNRIQKVEEKQDILWPKRTNDNTSLDIESSGKKTVVTKMITRADIDYMLNWDPTEARDVTKTKSSNESYNCSSTQSSWSLSKSSLEQQNSSKGESLSPNESSSFMKTTSIDQDSKGSFISKNTDENARRTSPIPQRIEKDNTRDDEKSNDKSSSSINSSESRSSRNVGTEHTKNQNADETNNTESDSMILASKANADFLPLILEENILAVNGVSYAKLGVIGKGGSCKVYRALSKTRSVVAIKRVKLAGMDKKGIQGYANEIKLLKRLRKNPFIIQLHDSEVDLSRKAIFLVMEVGEVDLNQVLQQQTLADEEKYGKKGCVLNLNFIRLTWQQMLSAVHSIHQERIIHGDLKPANFLFVRGALKLIDFGIAKAIQSDDTTNIYRESQIGTLNYMSPESILDTGTGKNSARMKCGRASDVWSLGCILYQMCYGRTPFAELHMFSKLQAIVNPKHKIKFPETVDCNAVDAIKSCLHRNPEERLPIVGVNGLLNEHCFLHSNRSRQS